MNAHQVEARRWFRQARADLEVVHTLRSAVPSETYTEAHAQTAREAAEHIVRMAEDFLRAHSRALE